MAHRQSPGRAGNFAQTSLPGMKIIVNRPDLAPVVKDPSVEGVAEMLRSLYARYPDAICTVVQIRHWELWATDGMEWLTNVSN